MSFKSENRNGSAEQGFNISPTLSPLSKETLQLEDEFYGGAQEAFNCDLKDLNDNDANQSSFEKLAETTAAMSQLDMSHDDMSIVLPPFRGLESTSRLTLLSTGSTSLESQSSSVNPGWGKSSSPDLPIDVAQLTPHQREQLIQQLHMLRERELVPSIPLGTVAPSRNGLAAYTWQGELPPRNYVHPVFSCKIFVGGVPWDITELALMDAFTVYGQCRVEWPGKEARYTRSHMRHSPRGKVTGYVYMIFEQERSVKGLLQDCSQEFGSAGEWYFKLKAKRNHTTEIRQVQVIPWVISDAAYVEDPSCRLDTKKTVFVGALHGMITAHVLFSIMNDLYGNVVFVGIDTDKYKYPIGSGRVTFRSHSSYFRAIESKFLEIKTSKFGKKVQIDPFLEDSMCMTCNEQPGPYFCRDRACFRYFCPNCWATKHSTQELSGHMPLMRNAPRPMSSADEVVMAPPSVHSFLPPHNQKQDVWGSSPGNDRLRSNNWRSGGRYSSMGQPAHHEPSTSSFNRHMDHGGSGAPCGMNNSYGNGRPFSGRQHYPKWY